MAFKRFNGEIFAVVDGDSTAAVDEREAATSPGLTIRPRLKNRIQRIRVKDVRQGPEGTGLKSFHGAHRAYDSRTYRFIWPNFIIHTPSMGVNRFTTHVFHPDNQK